MLGSVPRFTDGLSSSWVAESIVPSSTLCSHYCVTFNPVHVLGLYYVGPVVECNWSRDGSVDYSLSEGWVQSSFKQKNCFPGIPFPLCYISKVVEHHNVGVEVLSLHFDG